MPAPTYIGDLARRVVAAGRHGNERLALEIGYELGLAGPLDLDDTMAVYHHVTRRAPSTSWAVGIGRKGAYAQVGEQRVTSKAGPGAALAAALFLHLEAKAP